MKKLLIIVIVLISCESLISPLSSDDSINKNLTDFQKAIKLLEDVDIAMSKATNLFTFVVAISTDEAIESSSDFADDLLGKQIFDKENALVNDAYYLWLDLYTKSREAQTQLETFLDLSDGFDNFVASNPTKTNAALKSVSLFHKGYALYKLGSNWKSAKIDGQTFSSSQLLEMAKSSLDSAITIPNGEAYTYNLKDYTKAANIVRLRVFLRDSDHTTVLAQLGRGTRSDVIDVRQFNDQVNLVKKNSNPVGTKMIFDSNYLPDDARIAIVTDDNILLQGSTDSTQSNYYIQNVYKTLDQHYKLVNPDFSDLLFLNAEAQYHKGDYDLMVGLLNQIRSSTPSRTNPDSTIALLSTVNVTQEIAKGFLLNELLAEYFLRGQRLEILRRFNVAPFKQSATTNEYGFIPPSE